MMRTMAAVMAATTMWLGACAELDDVEVGATTTKLRPDRCPPTGCQDVNKAIVGLSWIHELATGTAEADARLVSFHVNRVPVSVSGGDIVGRRVVTDRELLRGELVIEAGGRQHEVVVRDVERVDYVHGASADRALFLSLHVRGADGALRPLCNSFFMTGPTAPAPAGYATLFTGDRYDLDTGEVSVPAPGIVTVACAGSPMARMHLERMTTAGSRGAAIAPTLEARQVRFDQLRSGLSAPPIDPTL